MLAKAKAKQAAMGVDLGKAFKQEFREVFGHLDDNQRRKTPVADKVA
jgi:hypothetical protein